MPAEHSLSAQLRTKDVLYDTSNLVPEAQMPLAELLKDRLEAVWDDYLRESDLLHETERIPGRGSFKTRS
jgi:hypothetical protein